MKNKALKIGLTMTVFAAALTGLLWTTLSEGTEYYKHVDEVMAEVDAWQGKRLQLHGFAADVKRKRDSLDYQFEMQYNGAVVLAHYTGVVPDTFKDESEVVARGRFNSDGTFAVEPNGIMAKCPSKYEAKPGLRGAPETSAAPAASGY